MNVLFILTYQAQFSKHKHVIRMLDLYIYVNAKTKLQESEITINAQKLQCITKELKAHNPKRNGRKVIKVQFENREFFIHRVVDKLSSKFRINQN